MTVQNGSRIPEMRRGGDARWKLCINHPETDQTLATIQIDSPDIGDTRRFSNAMLSARDLWRMGKPNRLSDQGRIRKIDAERLLRFELNRLAKGGAE